MGTASSAGAKNFTKRRVVLNLFQHSSDAQHDAVEGLLGYVAEPEMIHRDNLVLVRG